MFKLEKENNIDFLLQRENFRKNDRSDSGNREEVRREETEATKKQSGWPIYTEIPEGAEKKLPNERELERIRLKIRYDYRGTAKPARFFFGKKTTEETAEEIREQKMLLWQNIPLQGIRVEDIKVFDIYTFIEYHNGADEEVSYAPIEITITADSLEDCIFFISREEFRRVEILEPVALRLNAKDIEKLFIKFSQYVKAIHEEYQ